MRKKVISLLLLLTTCGFTQFLTNKVRISGQAGAYYETYNIYGREARRPPNTGRIYIRPTLNLFGLQFGLEADIFATTEQRYRVQDFNRYGINPKWKWGNANLGDFMPRWSRMTVHGIQVRGAGLEINPGLFRFSALGGRVMRSSRKPDYEAYNREQFGVSLGVGKKNKSYFDIMMLKTEDDPGSYTPDSTDTTPVTPQENLVLSANTSLSLFKRRIRFQGEFAGCLHSQDMRSSDLNIEGFEQYNLGGLFTPRFSSRADYAYSAEVAVQLKDYTVRTETSYIGPGYTSLGVYYLLNDQQIHAISADARLLERKLNLRANFRTRNDNLLDQKMYTTRRNSALFGINVRPLPTLLLVFNTNLNTIANDSDNDTLRVDMNIQGYTLVANYQFPLRQWTTNLNTTYSFQNSGDENPLRQTSNVTVNNFNAAYSVQLTQSWTVNTNLNYSDTQISGRNGVTMMGVGGGATHTALKRRLNTTFNLSFNNAQTGSTLGIVLNSSFRLTAKDNFSITFRNIGYTPDEEDIIREEESISIVPKRYNETIFTMRLTRRF